MFKRDPDPGGWIVGAMWLIAAASAFLLMAVLEDIKRADELESERRRAIEASSELWAERRRHGTQIDGALAAISELKKRVPTIDPEALERWAAEKPAAEEPENDERPADDAGADE